MLIGDRRCTAPKLFRCHFDRIATAVGQLRLDSPVGNLKYISFTASQFHNLVNEYSSPSFMGFFFSQLHIYSEMLDQGWNLGRCRFWERLKPVSWVLTHKVHALDRLRL